MSWRRYDLPKERDEVGRFLPWLIAFLVYLSIIALAGLLALEEMTAHWDRGVAGTMTVHVPPAAKADEAPRRMKNVLDVLAGTQGIARAEVISQERVAELLEPWLGPGVRDADLPLPVLVDVELASGASVDIAKLGAALEAAAPGTAVDDHQTWLRRLVSLAQSVEILAVGMLALVGFVTVLAVIFATRTALAVNREVIEVLHLIGAHDAYIAGQFATRAFLMGLRGGLFGLALAVPTLLGVGLLGARLEQGLLPQIAFGIPQWGAFVLVPVLAALTAMVSARMTVLRTLGRMV